MPNFKDYTDFLNDKQFIQWQLIPDKESNAYWKEFISAHPHIEEELQKAINYIKTTGLNNKTLTDSERQQLLDKIQTTIETNNRKLKSKRFLRYIAASCAAIVLIILGINLYFNSNKTSPQINSEEIIVGKLLNNEDIQLITENEIMSFQKDVQVQIEKDGIAKIIQENEAEKTLEISSKQLNKFVVPYGKRTQLNLADGSKVWLNSGSVLEFPSQFSGEKREIRLELGEMYMEVVPNETKPFFVHTADFKVQVHGTKLNISTYDDSPKSVVLVEGSVSLTAQNNAAQFLSPSEQGVLSENGTFNKQKVNATRLISWKNGYLAFDKTPMTEVLKQIGRYYNLSFDFGNDVNLQKRTCTGKIYLSDNLENVMTIISLLSSTKYIKTDNKIIITNESTKNQKPMTES